jgi:RecJ-like exonuclease
MLRARHLFVCLVLGAFYFASPAQSQTDVVKPKADAEKPKAVSVKQEIDANQSPTKYVCRCHSKSAPTRAMHEAVKNHDCFMCHKRGEKLRRKGGIPKETHEAFLKQRLTDPRCIQCHGKGTVVVPKPEDEKNPMVLSGSTYCPKCKIRGEKYWKMCPKCGGPSLIYTKLCVDYLTAKEDQNVLLSM